MNGFKYLNGKIPGVSVREYGGSMPVTSISIRGGDPSQVDQMIDGVSIVSARDGQPTGIFDPAVFTSVEIARGGAAPGGSGSGSAGAINYLPPLFSQPFSFSVSALSSGAVYFTSKYKGSAFSLRRNMGNQGTEGYSTTVLATGRLNSMKFGGIGSWATGGVEAPSWTLPIDGNRKQGQFKGWINVVSNDFEIDFNAGAGFMDYLQKTPTVIDDNHSDFSTGISLLWNGFVTVQSGLNSFWLQSTATDDHNLQVGTVHINKNTGSFDSSIGYRFDSNSNSNFSGRFTAEYQLKSLYMFSSIFTDHRVPTINDLYWPSDGYAMGNPDLQNERSTGMEIGLEWADYLFHGSLCGFYTISDDLIFWLPDNSGVWTPSNVSSSVSKGLEVAAGFTTDITQSSGTFTWNIATDETANTPREGLLLPYRPEYTWGFSTDILVLSNLSITVALNGMGKRFTNRTQSENLEEYWLMDVSVIRHFFHGINLNFGLDNIMDTFYEETNGYSGSSRSLQLTFEYTGE